jgi:4-carboxymuconolactone decarboxylase
LEEIAAIDPESGPPFVEELKKVSPAFAEYFVGFAWGKVHARNVLEPKVKELIAIANLIAIGEGKSHLRVRIQGACRAGCTKEEIIEVVIQSLVYVGFAKALVALHLVKEVCEECGGCPPPAPKKLETTDEFRLPPGGKRPKTPNSRKKDGGGAGA